MDRRFTPTTFLIWSGLLIWAADFLLIYVIQAIICAKGYADLSVAGLPAIPATTLLCTLAAMFATAFITIRCARRLLDGPSDQRVRFTFFITAAVGALALVAIVWTALPGLLLRTGCAA